MGKENVGKSTIHTYSIHAHYLMKYTSHCSNLIYGKFTSPREDDKQAFDI
jgi:hypothetical protein